ncbi:MAG: hypothetical protein RLY93_04700 [Sumerlaeia bacterium]
MKVLLLGRESPRIVSHVRAVGLEIVESGFDVVLCYGGDGTLLGAERDHPGFPKVPIRKRKEDERDDDGRLRNLLESVRQGRVTVTYLPKLMASTRHHRLYALNDLIVRNGNVTSGVRYRVEIEGVEYFGEIVGDGLVAATPFGSSAYYKTITNSVIHVGIGLAFNNSNQPVNHLVLDEESTIRVRIARGPAILAADNNPLQIPLIEGDVVDMRRCSDEAEVWEIDNLLCMDSGRADEQRRLRWIYPRIRQRRDSGPRTRGEDRGEG